jgi:esterase/lipase
VYHGAEDEICDAKASQEFVEGLDIKDKQIKVFEVSLL